jgi:hypothetical protein
VACAQTPSFYYPAMSEPQWQDAKEKKPWPFVAVFVSLRDGRQIQAVWTGHLWWGESRELRAVAWRPIKMTRKIAA